MIIRVKARCTREVRFRLGLPLFAQHLESALDVHLSSYLAGFAVLLNANLLPQVKLGILVLSTMIICFLATVVVLPLLLNYFKPDFIYKKRV